MLRDVRERRRGDALERELGFLDAEHQERHRARFDDARGEFGVVSRDVAERPRGGLLDARVELLEALHEGVEGAAVHHGLRERGRVLRHRPQDKRRGLLVKSVLLAERVDELGQDLVADDRLGEVVAVVGQSPERDRGALLDAALRGWDGAGRGGEVSAAPGRRKELGEQEGDYQGAIFGRGPERAGIGARRDVACAAIRACLPHRPE